MSSQNPPYPYFSGITFNSSFFSSTSSSLTQSQANLLYLKKTVADTATSLETFSGGILTTTLQAIPANTGSMAICSSQDFGNLHIGGAPNRGYGGPATAQINIGNGTANNFPINIGNFAGSTAQTNIGNLNVSNTTKTNALTTDSIDASATTASMTIGGGQTTGTLTIGGGWRLTTGNGGAINIGNGQNSTGPINVGAGLGAIVPIVLGTSSGTIALNAPTSALSLTTSNIYSGNIDASVGPSTGTLSIGDGAGTGTLMIGYTASSSRQINIGNASLQASAINIGASTGTIALGSPTTCSGSISALGLTSTTGITSTNMLTANGGINVAGGNLNVSNTTTCTGLLTANGGLTLGGSNNITLGSGAVAPTAGTQLGGKTAGAVTVLGITGVNTSTSIGTVTVPAVGTYICVFSVQVNYTTIPTTNYITVAGTVNSGIPVNNGTYGLSYPITNGSSSSCSCSFVAVVATLTSTATIVINYNINGTVLPFTLPNFNIYRIA